MKKVKGIVFIGILFFAENLNACLCGNFSDLDDIFDKFRDPATFSQEHLKQKVMKFIQNDDLRSLDDLLAALGSKQRKNLLSLQVAVLNSKKKSVSMDFLNFVVGFSDSPCEMVEKLVHYGAKVSVCACDGYSPLTRAIALDKYNIAKQLIELGADINAYDGNGNAALHVAVQKLHARFIPLLVRLGADINCADKAGWAPLNWAVCNNNKSMVEVLIKNGANINLSGEDGYSPLTRAVAENKYDIVKLFVSFGANINAYDANGNTAIYIVARDYPKLVPELIKLGADVNCVNKAGWSPLNRAVDNNNKSMVEALIKNGADINLSSKDGYSPLTRAVDPKLYEIVKLLVSLGADINAYDGNGNTAIYIAARDYPKLVPELIKLGADVNCVDEAGWSPLNRAVDNNNKSMVEALIKNGADINLSSKDGYSPLTRAVGLNLYDIVKLLVKLGANINAYDANRNTAICIAARDYPKLVPELIKLGADVNCVNKAGWSPLNRAVLSNNQFIVEVLLKHGAYVDFIDPDGNSPLHEALEKANDKIVEELLKNHANVNVKNSLGNTVLHVALEKSYDTLVPLLIKYGADVTIKNLKYVSPILLAASYNKKEILKLMLKDNFGEFNDDIYKAIYLNDYTAFTTLLSLSKTSPFNDEQTTVGIDFHALKVGNKKFIDVCCAQDKNFIQHYINGHYPLHYATMCGHDDLLQYFIEQFHVDVNTPDYYGLTPLHYAAMYGNYEIVNYLIEKKCLINPISLLDFDQYEKGLTPSDMALIHGNFDVAELLFKNGAIANNLDLDKNKINQMNQLAIFVDFKTEQKTVSQPLASINFAFSMHLCELIQQRVCPAIIIGQHLLQNALQLSCSLNDWIIIDISWKDLNGYLIIPKRLVNVSANTSIDALTIKLKDLGFAISPLHGVCCDEKSVLKKHVKLPIIKESLFSATVPTMLKSLLLPCERCVYWGGHGWAQDPASIGNLFIKDVLALLDVLAHKNTKIIYIATCFFGGHNSDCIGNFDDMIILSEATTEVAVAGKNGKIPRNWRGFLNGLAAYKKHTDSRDFCGYLAQHVLPLFVTPKPAIANFPHIKFPKMPFRLLSVNDQAMLIDLEALSTQGIFNVDNKRVLEIAVSYVEEPVNIKNRIPLFFVNKNKSVFNPVVFDSIVISDIKDIGKKDLVYVFKKLTRAPIFMDSPLENTFLIKELKFTDTFLIDVTSSENKKTPEKIYNVVIQRGPSDRCHVFFSTNNITVTPENCVYIAYDHGTESWKLFDHVSGEEFTLYQRLLREITWLGSAIN